MMQSIVINERSAATVRNILDTIEAGRKASEHLPTYVEALRGGAGRAARLAIRRAGYGIYAAG